MPCLNWQCWHLGPLSKIRVPWIQCDIVTVVNCPKVNRHICGVDVKDGGGSCPRRDGAGWPKISSHHSEWQFLTRNYCFWDFHLLFQTAADQVTKTAARGSCVQNYTGFSVVLAVLIYWIHYFRLSVILSWGSRGRWGRVYVDSQCPLFKMSKLYLLSPPCCLSFFSLATLKALPFSWGAFWNVAAVCD